MDGIELEIVWSNLISIVSEQAKALRRIAFSPVVREAGDLANALFDKRGRMVAQAVTGTPGHINSLAAAGKHFVEAFPTQTLNPGDVLITNDPWLSAGHPRRVGRRSGRSDHRAGERSAANADIRDPRHARRADGHAQHR